MKKEIVLFFLLCFGFSLSMEQKNAELRKQGQRELSEKNCQESCETLICCLGTVLNLTFLYYWAGSCSSKNS